jgi:ribonuclease HII
MNPKVQRPALKRTHERAVDGLVCGVDEAGRGPLAGPVVAAAIILPARMARALSSAIDDSKRLPPDVRESLSAALLKVATVGIGTASVAEIDEINILRASLLAMHRAVEALAVTPAMALVDGNQKPPLSLPCRMIVGGDGLELSIAAASIIAKVHRDRLMTDLHQAHPHYGWHSNAGYATPSHRAALRRHGPCIHHRRSFAPVAQAELDFASA